MLGIRSEERVRGERRTRQSDTIGMVASHNGSHPRAQIADVFPRKEQLAIRKEYRVNE